MSQRLLHPDDPAPVCVLNAAGRGEVLLLGDHAGRAVPRALGDMGVGAADWARHIAWDIGVAGLCDALSKLLDATYIGQAYSRLVIDCNRRPGHPTSIIPVSDGTLVPANSGVSAAQARARVTEIFAPYHAAIAAELDRRAALRQPTVLIAMHSFTPVYAGFVRPWQAGVLYNRYPPLAQALKKLLLAEGFVVGDNEPYRLSDDSDYAVPVHAEPRGLCHVELEIRQDLIADAAGQAAWAGLLARLIPAALAEIRA